MAEAKVQYDQHVRWEHFKRTSDEWRKVAKHREFLAEARAVAAAYECEERDAIVPQFDMAERRLNKFDPLGRPQLRAPVVKEPKNDDLKPLLGRWSSNGPDSH